MATNLGVGETYLPGTAVFVAGANPPSPFYEAEARLFTATGDYDVTQIDIALVHVTGSNAATVTLRTDMQGMPGAVVGSWSLSNLPELNSTPYPATIVGTQVISGISNVSLLAGQSYFLEADPGQSDSEMGWFGFGPSNEVTFSTHSPNGPWFSEGLYDLGFTVLGDPAIATPEPQTALLFPAGVFCFAPLMWESWTKRRRRCPQGN